MHWVVSGRRRRHIAHAAGLALGRSQAGHVFFATPERGPQRLGELQVPRFSGIEYLRPMSEAQPAISDKDERDELPWWRRSGRGCLIHAKGRRIVRAIPRNRVPVTNEGTASTGPREPVVGRFRGIECRSSRETQPDQGQTRQVRSHNLSPPIPRVEQKPSRETQRGEGRPVRCRDSAESCACDQYRYSFDKDEASGYLDRARITRVVSDPCEPIANNRFRGIEHKPSREAQR
jgi:hypothetical protein